MHAPSVSQREVNANVAQAQVEIPKDGLLTSPHGIQHDETPQEDARVTGVCTPCQEDTEESGVVAEVTPIQESANETSTEDSTIIHQESGEAGTHPDSQMMRVQKSTPSANSSTLAEKANKEYEPGADTTPLQESTDRDEPVGSEPRVSQVSDYRPTCTENRSGVQSQRFQVPDAKPEGRAHDQTTSKEKEGEQVHTESTTGSVQRVENLTHVETDPQKPKEKGESPQTKEPKKEAAQESNQEGHQFQGQAVQQSEGLSPAEVGNSGWYQCVIHIYSYQ